MTIAVYCSAKDNIGESYLSLGDELGRWIARQGDTLLYGGATGGLMSRVSNAAHQAGGRVMGVVPEHIIKAGRRADNCDELIVVRNMCERKQTMRANADVFVCLPGSYGTLDEMMDVIASGTVGEHKKPILILNHDGFYDKLEEEIEEMRHRRFLPQQESYKPIFVHTLEEIYLTINTYRK